MLISSTSPSNPLSRLNRFLKLTCDPPAATTKFGETSSVLPMLLTSGAKASFGAVSGLVVDVTHGTSTPVAVVVQPAGSAGAVTPSKFSLHETQFNVDVVIESDHELSVPVSTAVSSLMVSVQVPFGLSPIKSASASSGVSGVATTRFAYV